MPDGAIAAGQAAVGHQEDLSNASADIGGATRPHLQVSAPLWTAPARVSTRLERGTQCGLKNKLGGRVLEWMR